MPFTKPFSDACARNQQAIASVIGQYLDRPMRVLEIGSGTGQHAVFMTRLMPHLTWQPTELAESLAAVELWRGDAGQPNLLPPVELDVNRSAWPTGGSYDAVFTANTVHYVSWHTVENLFRGASTVLATSGTLLVYGPFNEGERYTSEGNEQLDQWLKQRDPESGIKDRSAVIDLATSLGLTHIKTHQMPANNELLSFNKA